MERQAYEEPRTDSRRRCLERAACSSSRGPRVRTTPPYAPIAAALRSYERARPGGLRQCGPLSHYLAVLVPELGRPPVAFDGPTLVEAIRCAFEAIAERDATAMVLHDLPWADEATP